MKIRKSLFPAFILSIISTSLASGATVLTETFTYANGALVGSVGSPWISHSGTASQVDVTSGVVNLVSTETEDVSALLSGQPYTTGLLTATFDVRFTVLPAAAGTYFAHFKDGASGFRSRLTSYTTGAATGFFRLAISNDGGATVPVPTDLSLNTTYAVTMTWDMATLRSSLSVAGGSSVVDTDTASAITVTSFAFRQNTGIGTLTGDNLVVTHVPEPAAAVLGSLGLLVLLRRRR